LFANSPTALLFGCWDSTGAAGGLGNKFARAITSEIVGINAEWGTTQGGVRQDPFGISAEVEIAIDDSGEWAMVGKSATGKKDRAKGTRPSEVNHGSILVKVEQGENERLFEDGIVKQRLPLKGGVTVDHALQTTVLSLTALRRLKFPIGGESSSARDKAARTVLAALGLIAITTAREQGYWLRSRCGLVAESAQELEIILADGKTSSFACDSKRAVDEYRQAIAGAKKAGLPWAAEPVLLKPQQKLVDLIKKSREIQSLGK
jgi:CRISPR-associated protein Csb1